MRISKRSSEFRGAERCNVLRKHEALTGFETLKNSAYDNAIIVKEIIKGYFKGEFKIEEFPDLVSQGVGDDYVTEKQGNLRREMLVKCLTRLCKSETRIPKFASKKVIQVGNYDVSVSPDVIFDDGQTIEVVMYRAGKPSVKAKGRKLDGGPKTCLELYFMVLYGRTLVKKGEVRNIRASYYFLRKDTDKKDAPWDNDFFSGNGGNVVFLEDDPYLGGSDQKSELDIHFEDQLLIYEEGSEEVSDDVCSTCRLKTACKYKKAPQQYQKQQSSTKKGKIVPSDAQQKIIDFKKGVCRVNATAGSGKTECMTERGARMFEDGVDPSEMLFITFTDAGALEMKERIAKKCAARNLSISADDIRAITFNKFAYDIVRDKYADLGFTKTPKVIDDIRSSVVITQLLDEHVINGLDYYNFLVDTKDCKGAHAVTEDVFDIIKSNNIDIDSSDSEEEILTEVKEKNLYRFLMDNSVPELVDLYTDYCERLTEDNFLQFADQEPMMNKILNMYTDYLNSYGFKHIIVDEFQDTNDVQLKTIKKLTECPSFESLMVVGDDAQSIYGFRKTSQENILHFFEKIGMDGEDLYLVENRRSTPQIISLANNLNALNVDKVDKDIIATREDGKPVVVRGFHKKAAEYEFIACNIKRLIEQGTAPEDIAVITRVRSELDDMAVELSKYDIPWTRRRVPYSENSRVQAALALAEAFYQPEADQLYFDYLVAVHDGDVYNVPTEDLKAEVAALKNEFMNMDFMEIPVQREIFHDKLEAIKGTDEVYASFLDLIYQNEDLQSELEYIHNFRIYGKNQDKTMEGSYTGVVLTTAHSSKGLEWPVVFTTVSKFDKKSLHTGRNKRSQIEEERRLLFVAITRARDFLCVTGQYVAYGSKDDRTYNQFLKEIFECVEQEYDPVDYTEDIRSRLKADAKHKVRSMTPEEIKEYENLIRNSEQVELLDLLKTS